jgi:hypothetical protein
MTAPAPAVARRPLVTRRRIVYTVVLAGAAVALVAAFTIHPDPVAVPRDPAVVAVSPKENDTDVRQTTISVDLATTYSGSLRFDGVTIPDDQVDRIQTGYNRISFTPGPGKEFRSLPAGRHCAAVTYWPTGQDPVNTSKTYAWCFNLH